MKILEKIVGLVSKKAKANFVRHSLKKVGVNFLFDSASSFLTPDFIEIGDNVFIGEYAHISAEISIGNNVMFGPRPVIIGGDHYFGVKGRFNRFLKPKGRENYQKISIEDDCWFGANVTILKGVTVGFGVVVGAGSVVCKSLPRFTVCVGNPCGPVKKIFFEEVLLSHLLELGYSEQVAGQVLLRRKKAYN